MGKPTKIEHLRGYDVDSLMARGIHTREEVISEAIEIGIIDADLANTFTGETESGWWKAVPHCEGGHEYHQSKEGVRGAFPATFVERF